jgi:hypothetical protein
MCGRTTGRDAPDNAYVVTWQCIGCVLPDHSDRELVMYVDVAVTRGTIPTWSIGADFGA